MAEVGGKNERNEGRGMGGIQPQSHGLESEAG